MPNWRRMAETAAILTHSASSSSWDRLSNGRQPAALTGRLPLSHFTTGSRKGRRRCSAPHPSPNLTTSSGDGRIAAGESVALKRPARGNGLVSGTGGFGPPPLLNAVAEPEGVFVAGSQRENA